jgi:hypothetical protein
LSINFPFLWNFECYYFWCHLKKIYFLISFLEYLLLSHGKITDFCILILYPVILLSMCVSSNITPKILWISHTGCFFIFSMQNNALYMSIFNSECLWSDFSCLISLTRILSTMLSRSDLSKSSCSYMMKIISCY